MREGHGWTRHDHLTAIPSRTPAGLRFGASRSVSRPALFPAAPNGTSGAAGSSTSSCRRRAGFLTAIDKIRSIPSTSTPAPRQRRSAWLSPHAGRHVPDAWDLRGISMSDLDDLDEMTGQTWMPPRVLRKRRRLAAGTQKTHCTRGHELTPDNFYLGSNGARNCKRCQRLFYLARREGRRS